MRRGGVGDGPEAGYGAHPDSTARDTTERSPGGESGIPAAGYGRVRVVQVLICKPHIDT
ncbi:hypothetical protein GCM10010140_44050 [Streptosporangium pseudovulgare]|uniref:Uncharacterized protein n=1 Tax=Streptosporangium pseudovulgare TaxID=35765 RepID=A0ABQ2R1V2_9ACTN|nr:hypothetical protein GCM10010140_44050 [Streptosporangium pseudovulgare]